MQQIGTNTNEIRASGQERNFEKKTRIIETNKNNRRDKGLNPRLDIF